MPFRLLSAFLFVGALNSATCGAASLGEEVTYLEMGSHVIVSGVATVPATDIRERLTTGKHDYILIRMSDSSFIKGRAAKEFNGFRWYTDTQRYGGVSPDQLLALDGRRIVVFLVYLDSQYYLADYIPLTVQLSVTGLEEELRSLASETLKLALESEAYAKTHQLAHEGEVSKLISSLLDRTTAEAATNNLLSLDCSFVPALIKYLDDRRPLAVPYLRLKNTARNAFEGYAQYSPKTVLDILSVVLSRITESNLAALYNGGSDYQREQAVIAWRAYERRALVSGIANQPSHPPPLRGAGACRR